MCCVCVGMVSLAGNPSPLAGTARRIPCMFPPFAPLSRALCMPLQPPTPAIPARVCDICGCAPRCRRRRRRLMLAMTRAAGGSDDIDPARSACAFQVLVLVGWLIVGA